MATVPSKPPRFRKMSMRGLVFAVAGAERAYPVYRFSRGKAKVERPRHNPFKNL